MVGTRRAEERGAGELGQLGDARDYDARYALVVPPNASQDLTRPSLPRLLVFIDADAVVGECMCVCHRCVGGGGLNRREGGGRGREGIRWVGVGGRRRERADGMQKQVTNFEQTRFTSC